MPRALVGSQREFEAAFLLAGFEFTDVFPIENGYCGNHCCPDKPWFLFRTEFGLIKIGWRKRVVNIDWSDTGMTTVEFKDDVTKGETYIHAWGYAKVVEYLDTLLQLLRRKRRNEKRATP